MENIMTNFYKKVSKNLDIKLSKIIDFLKKISINK